MRVKLFGSPLVTFNDKTIIFSFKKAEALFYYMLLKKDASREELISLFWADQDEEMGRKNLRNALYSVKKAFNIDIFIAHGKSNLTLNPEILINCDVVNFLNSDSIEEYKGDFLEGFCIKDCEPFEEFVMQKREELKEIYKKRLYNKINLLLKEHKINEAKDYAKRILIVDEFDERAIRLLMQIYSKSGEINKAVELYKSFQEKLYKELGINPDAKTKNLYEKIILERKEEQKKFFYGRDLEYSKLLQNFSRFNDGLIFKNILVVGEAGIGKTRLIEEFLDSFKGCKIIKANCYAAEESYILKPWGDILNLLDEELKREDIPKSWKIALSSFFPSLEKVFQIDEVINYDTNKYKLIEEIIISIILNLSNKQKILIIFEDLHWMDNISLSILKKLLTLDRKNLSFILTARYDKKVNNFYSELVKYDRIEKLELLRFNKEDTKSFVLKALSKEVPDDLLQNIYIETEGNTFFIVEYVNLLKNGKNLDSFNIKLKEILNTRFLGISKEAQRMLDIISMFYDEAPYEYIKLLSNMQDDELIEILDELIDKFILIESKKEDIFYKFTHQKLRDFVYENQSEAKKRVLHLKIANLIEGNLKGDKRDAYYYEGLIYHFEGAGERLKAVKYKLKNLCEYLNYTNELFPEGSDIKYFDREGQKTIFKNLDEIEEDLEKIKSSDEEYTRLSLLFCYLKGRYFIWEGEYTKGTSFIKRAIEISRHLKDDDMLLKSLRQMINYAIQVHDVEAMGEYIDESFKIATKLKNKKEIAVLLRLKGLNYIMHERFERAEDSLKHSLMILEGLNNDGSQVLNIAAALNYLGNIKRLNVDFKGALKYYNQAIEMCLRSQIKMGLTVFLTSAGHASYEMGDYLKAKDYLTRAVEIYEKIDAYWLRAVAEGYLSLALIKEGKIKIAKEHLKRADAFAQKLKSPYENGILLRIKAEIKNAMEYNERIRREFEDYFKEDIEYYCTEGIKLLKKVKENYQVDILKTFLKSRD
ncbi:MAG: AAA family ATPase [Caloramator sp.]|nr:AAA family ATPase [Caloramator sp.]